MKCKKHEFTPIAPELSDDWDYEPCIWKWCIRCGTLELGGLTFTYGKHQKKAIIADQEK